MYIKIMFFLVIMYVYLYEGVYYKNMHEYILRVYRMRKQCMGV